MSLAPDHKWETGLKGFTAAGISLGVIIAITHSKDMFSGLFSNKSADNQTSR